MQNRQARKRAGDVLYEAFSEELALLRVPPKEQGIENDFNVILENAFRKHQAAILHFNRHLCDSKSIDFMNAWEKYYSRSDGEKIYFDQYAAMSSGFHNQKEPRLVAIERIEKILSFT